MAISTHTTLAKKINYGKNQVAPKGKQLSYYSLTIKQGETYVSIVEDDMQSQVKYWKFVQLVFMIMDTPYLKSIEAYNFHACKTSSIES